MEAASPPAHGAPAAPAVVVGRIKHAARSLGFDAVGIADVGPLEASRHYEAWLAAGRHGGMRWLSSPKHRARRADPALILPRVRAVVCVALCHPPARDAKRDARLGRIALYAAGEDYHRVMRDKMRVLQRTIGHLVPGARALWYSDTGAILERGWAERAGLGWIGRHSGLLSQELGSWFLLGEVLVDRPLLADPPAAPRCGTCRRCVDACPTGAIVADYQVDARRCISYLTIEHRGPIPIELRGAISDWIFGCDLCQDVCPWNRFAPPAREARLHARELEGWDLERFLTLDDAGFDALFAGSPIRRTGRDGFLRNVCVALGNRGESSAIPALIRTLEGDRSELVRGHAAWALGEIARGEAAPEAERALASAAESDRDPAVRDERAALVGRIGRDSEAAL